MAAPSKRKRILTPNEIDDLLTTRESDDEDFASSFENEDQDSYSDRGNSESSSESSENEAEVEAKGNKRKKRAPAGRADTSSAFVWKSGDSTPTSEAVHQQGSHCTLIIGIQAQN